MDTITRLAAEAPTQDTLREVVHALAPLERRAGSDGEHQAARWLATRLEAAGDRGPDRGGAVPRRLRARDRDARRRRGARRGGGAAPSLAARRRGSRRARDRGDRRRHLERTASVPASDGAAANDLERGRPLRRSRCHANTGRPRPSRRCTDGRDLRRSGAGAAWRAVSRRDRANRHLAARCGGRCSGRRRWSRSERRADGEARSRRACSARWSEPPSSPTSPGARCALEPTTT